MRPARPRSPRLRGSLRGRYTVPMPTRTTLLALLATALGACSGGGGAPAGERTGAQVFEQSCSACHGPNGEGSPLGLGPAYAGLRQYWDTERLLRYLENPAAYAATDPRLGKRPMPAIQPNVTPAERQRLAEFVLARME